MNREEAAEVVKELLLACEKMDDIYLCMVPPTGSTPIATTGYQIHVKVTSTLSEGTVRCIKGVTKKHKLSAQEIKEDEKMIIYREHCFPLAYKPKPS